MSFSPDGLRLAAMGSDMGSFGPVFAKVGDLGRSARACPFGYRGASRVHLRRVLRWHRAEAGHLLHGYNGSTMGGVPVGECRSSRASKRRPWKKRIRHYARNYWRRASWHRLKQCDRGLRVCSRVNASSRWDSRLGARALATAGTHPRSRIKSTWSSAYTGVLDAVFLPDMERIQWDDDLSGLPVGCQEFGGVRDSMSEASFGCVRSQQASSSRPTALPAMIFRARVGIVVGSKIQRIHVIHAATALSRMGTCATNGNSSTGTP